MQPSGSSTVFATCVAEESEAFMETDKQTASGVGRVRPKKRPGWQTLLIAVAGLLLATWLGIVLFFRIVGPFC